MYPHLKKHVLSRLQEQEITWLYMTLSFGQTRQMLILLSFTTEIDLFLRAAQCHILQYFLRESGSIQVFGKPAIYPSPKLALTLTSHWG